MYSCFCDSSILLHVSVLFFFFVSPSSGYNLFICPLVHGQFIWDHFLLGATVNKAAMKLSYKSFCGRMFSFLWGLLVHRLGIHSVHLPYCEMSVQILCLSSGLFVFLLLCCSSFYILDTSPLTGKFCKYFLLVCDLLFIFFFFLDRK